VSDSEINIEKPPGAQPHDVLAHADRVSKFPNGRPRMSAIFDTVAGQIRVDIERAKAAATKEEAVAIFEATFNEYQQNRTALLDKLDSLVKG
jgi:hypothetical protein